MESINQPGVIAGVCLAACPLHAARRKGNRVQSRCAPNERIVPQNAPPAPVPGSRMLEAPLMPRPEVLVKAAGSSRTCPEDILHPGVPVIISFPPPVTITRSSQNGALRRPLDEHVVTTWAELGSHEAEIKKTSFVMIKSGYTCSIIHKTRFQI